MVTQKQLNALEVGRGFWFKRATPCQRKKFQRAGGKALAAKLGSEGMKQKGLLAARGTRKNISQVTKLGNQNAESGFLDQIRTHEGSVRGAIRSCHLRWHVERGISNPKKCELCRKELEHGKDDIRRKAEGTGQVVGAGDSGTSNTRPETTETILERQEHFDGTAVSPIGQGSSKQ